MTRDNSYRQPSPGETPLSRQEIEYGIAAGLIDLPNRPIIAICAARFQVGNIGIGGKGGRTRAVVPKLRKIGYVAMHAHEVRVTTNDKHSTSG